MEKLLRIPRANYANHPAYGELFGKPSLFLRARALKRFLPQFFRQIKRAIAENRRPVDSLELTAEDNRRFPLLATLVRDGIAALNLSDQEITRIRQNAEPHIQDLQKHKYSIPVGKRQFKDKVRAIPKKEFPEFFTMISEILGGHQVIETLSRYRGFALAFNNIFVHISDPDDVDWRNKFSDINLPDPKSVYMHFDSKIQRTKCLLYLTTVTADNGPFCHIRGSNRIKTGFLEYVTRKANDKSGLDGWEPQTRRLFSALPKFFQHKSEFGNDLSDSDPETQKMLALERQFTTTDGNLLLFDTDSLHRGGMIKEGQRIMLQIDFVRASSA